MMIACMAAVLVSGNAALAAEQAPNPRTTVQPIYTLPDTAAADGKLGEWAGIPPVPAERFGIEPYNPRPEPAQRPAPENFAPTLRYGMKPGSPDLYFLIVVQDSQRYTEQMAYWVEGDRVELFLDFGRQARDEQHPGWLKLKGKDRDRFFNPPGMGQFGLGPQTLAVAAEARIGYDAAKWKYDYACVPVEGGVAYELRVDGRSVLDALGAKALPERVGFHLTLDDQDYPLVLRTEGWNNPGDRAWLFTRDRMVFRWTDGYGPLSLRPQPAEAAATVPVPKTLAELFGIDPTAAQIEQSTATLPAERLADLVYWAGLNGVEFSPKLATALMQAGAPLVRENCLAVLCYTKQPKETAQAACAAAYAAPQVPNVTLLASLVNEKYALGFVPEVTKLVVDPDLNVAIAAARALAKVGTAADIAPLEQAIAARITDLKDSATIPERQRVGLVRAVEVFMGPSLEALKLRTEPITIPTATPVVTVKAENTDLPRLMPLDNNNVYNAKGLLRAWPKDGPKELWRVAVGEGKSAVTEVDGRAFTAAQFDGKQWALCLTPATGATIWKREIYPKQWKHITNGPVVTPLVDGDRVYFIPKMDVGYNPLSPVYCLNAEDGAVIWRSDDNEYFAQPDATPLIIEDTLYIPAGKSGKAKILVAVDKLTGKLRWSVTDPQNRPKVWASSACPAYQIIDGIPQVIFGVYSGAKEAWGISAKTGEVYWSYPTPLHHSLISSPVATGSRVVLCGGQGSAAFSACLQMYVRDGKLRARQLYRSEKNQVNMYHTVAVLNGAVYGFSGKSLQCTSLEDGRVLWEQTSRDWGNNQPLIVADGLIFAITKKGDLVMIEANQTGYKELGRVATKIKLGIPQQPTLANGRLYVRGNKTVVCYDVLSDGSRAEAEQETPAVKDGAGAEQKTAGSATGLIPDGTAEHWPGFRGPGGLAAPGAGKAPTIAPAIGRVAWKAKLSHIGNGSPIVWGEHVFVTGADKKLGVITCFKTDTGEQVWRREVPLTGPAKPMEETGYATPTPAIDGKRIYAIFATGDVAAFDLDGKPAWQAKMGEYKDYYGYASSLVLCRDRLLVQYDQMEDGESALLALDVSTGKIGWRAKRNMGPSWSTPLVIGTRRGPQVIVCANNGIAAYAPKDGREIWTVHCEAQDMVPVPTVAGGLIIAAMTDAGTLAISPDGDGDVTKTHVVWHNEDAVSDVPSPVGFGDLFFQLYDGTLTCHKAADGKEVGAMELDGEFYASPILCEGALLLLDRDGAMTAVKAGPTLEKIGARAVGKSGNASPAIAGNRLFVRTDKALVCIDRSMP
jgi:outer membrane protein assembly factor BamB